jgi:hypothetical protein
LCGLLLNSANSLGLDHDLVGHGRQAQDAPSGTIVYGLFFKNRLANFYDGAVLRQRIGIHSRLFIVDDWKDTFFPLKVRI